MRFQLASGLSQTDEGASVLFYFRPRVLPYNFEARVKFHIPACGVTDPMVQHRYQRDGEPVHYSVRLEIITAHCRGRLLNQGC